MEVSICCIIIGKYCILFNTGYRVGLIKEALMSGRHWGTGDNLEQENVVLLMIIWL